MNYALVVSLVLGGVLLVVVLLVTLSLLGKVNRALQDALYDRERFAIMLQTVSTRADKAERTAAGQADELSNIARYLRDLHPDKEEVQFLRHLVNGLQERLMAQTSAATIEAAKANARVLAIIDSKAEGLVTGQVLAAGRPVVDDLRSSPPETAPVDPIRIPEERSRRQGETRIDRPEPPSTDGSQYTGDAAP